MSKAYNGCFIVRDIYSVLKIMVGHFPTKFEHFCGLAKCLSSRTTLRSCYCYCLNKLHIIMSYQNHFCLDNVS